MEINDLRIEKFNKISKLNNLSKPELLSNISIIDSFDYSKNVQSFHGKNILTQLLIVMETYTKSTSVVHINKRKLTKSYT